MKKLIFFLMILSAPSLCLGYGNHQALEIINIKASGTGSPAITQYNRIFRAYPGIAYEIPVGAAGGKYPYAYSLSNAPDGMTIGARTGIINWPSPQTSASDIVVRVTDEDGDYVEATWSITVGTSGFLFVDDTTDASGTGTIDDPYDSIQDILDLGSAAVNSIVYFRAGSYAVPQYNSRVSDFNGCNLQQDGGRAHIWIGYPGESVTLNFSGVSASYADGFETWDGGFPNIWFSNMRMQSGYRYGWRIGAGDHYFTYYDMELDDFTHTTFASNAGGLFCAAGAKSYIHVSDSYFTNFIVAQGIGSLYTITKGLFERNQFTGKTDTSGGSPDLTIKQGNNGITVRGNYFYSSTPAMGTSSNGVFHDCQNIEIVFNYIRSSSGFASLNRDANQGATWVERNTFAGQMYFENLDYPDSCEGPWNVEANVFQNINSGWHLHYSSAADGDQCVTSTDNSGATSGLIDTDGKLLSPTYVGTRGWQFADGSTPIEGAPTITRGGRLSGSLSGGGVMR